MKFLYRDILKKSWVVTRKLKFLWFFGAFAALTANGEEYDIIVRNFDTVASLEARVQDLRNSLDEGVWSVVSENLRDFFTTNIFSSLIIVLAGILIIIAAIYLITISQVAIIRTASRFEKGKNNEFFDGFVEGTKLFWPISILNIAAKVVIYGLLLLIGIPLALSYVNSGNIGILTTLSLFSFLVLIPFNIFVSFIVRYASINIILNGAKVVDSIKYSFRLFRKNWLITLENAFLLYTINFIVTFIVVAVLTFVSLPFTAIGYVLFMACVIFVGAIVAVFRFSVWTYLFNAISEGQGISKLMRIFKRTPKEIQED